MEEFNLEKFIEKSNKKHKNYYSYVKSIYINKKTKLIITCPIHGDFLQAPVLHISGCGCKKCKNRQPTQEEFVAKANKKHKNFYNYDKSIYVNYHTKIIITCPEHGDFLQTPNGHLFGNGCRKCANKNKRKSQDIFIKEASEKYNFKYDYSESNYINNNTKIIIICPIHKKFKKTPNQHMHGQECPQCVKEKNILLKQEKFIKMANIKHNGFYNYDKVVYINAHTKIIITCPIHGDFTQTPNSHLFGKGCPNHKKSFSKMSKKWLDSFKISTIIYHHNLIINNKSYEVDGYDPITNTVYEFHGDFWHGNPDKFNKNEINPITKTTFGFLYKKTLIKENIIKSAGYNLVVIWEKDFLK